ncbi:MFS transporter [Bacillus cereus]|uniref:MFS transporter n=1 Tax=Bacillus cereus TaxID=1396 RepID=A0A9W7Q2F4_BACCE|nr:MFS transporter [Bacillus cereus]KAA6459464.1 MFS transporter [Bacillus cereus]KAB2502434.1 MFS transporter [Bacillus cereus]
MLSALRNKNFCLLFLGLLTSHIGNSIFILALFWYIQLKTDDARYLIILGFLTTIPTILGFLGGVLADKYDRKVIMMLSDFIRFISVILMVFLLTFYSFNFTYLAIMYLIINLGNFIFIPASSAIIPDLVEEKDLIVSNGLIQSSGQFANIFGAVLSGVLLTLVEVRVLFLINAFTFIVSILCVALLKTNKQGSRKESKTSNCLVKNKIIRGFNDFSEGLKYMYSYKILKIIIPGIFLINLFYVPFFTLGPAWSSKVLDMGSKGYSLMEFAIGAGVLTGSLTSKIFEKFFSFNRSIVISLILMMTIVLFSFNPNIFTTVLSLYLFSVGLGLSNTLLFTMMHQHVKGEFRGRVFGSFFSIVGIAFPIGTTLFGALLTYLSIESVFVISTSALFISALYLLVSVRRFYIQEGAVNFQKENF